MKKTWFGIMALVLSIAIVSGTGIVLSNHAKADATLTEASTAVSSPFTEAIDMVHDSVVGVTNYQKVSSNPYGNRGGNWGGFPFGNFGFGDFGFGNFGWGNGYDYGEEEEPEAETKEVEYGYGSGVCIAKEYVLTNFHVVENASSLKVTHDKVDYDAVLKGYDEALDIAVVYVPGLPCEPVVIGDSDALRLGDWAIVIGNPLSMAGTVTVGIISGLNREVVSDSTDAYGKKVVNTSIQTDAAINSGVSGGGLFNVAGELVGIPYMKYSGTTSTGAVIEGVGMIIPINSCKELVKDILSGNYTLPDDAPEAAERDGNHLLKGNKPRIGVSISNMNSSNTAVTQGVVPIGAYVNSVEEGSPAEAAGIQEGDIIVEIDGTIIKSSSDMTNLLQSKNIGDKLSIKLYRVEDRKSVV